MKDQAAIASHFRARSGALEGRLQPLPDKPLETAANTLRALWHLAAGRPMSIEAAAVSALPPLDEAADRRLEELIGLRLSGIPLAHLTGRERFMGIDLFTSPDALIPRHETELVGRAALECLHSIGDGVDRPLVLDICTGSGNLALAIAYHAPRTRVFGSDISADAIKLARRNVEHLGLKDRVEFRAGDLFEPFEAETFVGNVDLVVCNPPYISTGKVDAMAPEIREFEPRLAFDGGALGIGVVNRLIRETPKFLRAGGWFAVELGLGQAEATIKRMEHVGAFESVQGIPNDGGDLRVVVAKMSSHPAAGRPATDAP